MFKGRSLVMVLSAAMVGLGAGGVFGQDYPNKPIRIVTGSAGGSSDFVARQIAQGISGPLGQPVAVDNRGGGIIQAEIVSKAMPDGYILLGASNSLWVRPLLEETPYDAVRNFSPITLAASSPNVLVVHPSLPVKSVKELIGLAKARPGELNYASTGTGSTSHLTAELFKSMAGVKIERIAYKAGSVQMADLLAGRVQMTFDQPPVVALHVKLGKLKALAVTSAKPSALFPGLPMVAASGLPGFEVLSINCMFAPARTPETIINRLNQEMVRVLNRADMTEKFISSGMEVVASSPGELAATMKSEMARLGKVIKDAGIRAE